MYHKVIFIDIDGPLSWGTWHDGRVKISEGTSSEFTIPYPWEKEECDALYEVIKQTNAQLVVSSDWRKFYGLYQLQSIFEHYGIGKWDVIDTTTNYNPMRKLSSPPEWDRGCEIRSWVKTFRPTHWVAIDDLPLKSTFKSLRIPKWRHIQVDGAHGYGGRLANKVDEVVKLLNR